MLEYITTAILALFSGLIGLSDKQATRRGVALKKVPDQDNVYEIIKPIQFKVGEVIGLENPDKVTLSKVDPTPETLDILAALEEERIQDLIEKKAKDLIDCQEAEGVAAGGDPDPQSGQVAPGDQDPLDGQVAGGDKDPLETPVEGFIETPGQVDLDFKVNEDVIRAAAAAIEAGEVTSSGAPSVAAMEKILGFDVTAELRDVAWAELKKGADNA